MRNALLVAAVFTIVGRTTSQAAEPSADLMAAIDTVCTAFNPPKTMGNSEDELRKKLQTHVQSADSDAAEIGREGLKLLAAVDNDRKRAEEFHAVFVAFAKKMQEQFQVQMLSEIGEELFGEGADPFHATQEMMKGCFQI